MKRGTCIKCGGQRVGHFETVADKGDGTGSKRELAIAHESTGWFKLDKAMASVEAYVCADCGYFEEYVKEPATIDWEIFVRTKTMRWTKPSS